MTGYRLGMAMQLTMARYEEMILNFSCWETSHRKPALIILLRGKSLLLQNRRKRKRALESHRRVNKNFISLLPLFLGRIFWLLLTKGLCSTMSKKTQNKSHSHDQDETEISQLGIRDAQREKAVGASCRRAAAWMSRSIVLSGWNDTFFAMSNHILAIRLGCWIQWLLQQWCRALGANRCTQMPLGIV